MTKILKLAYIVICVLGLVFIDFKFSNICRADASYMWPFPVSNINKDNFDSYPTEIWPEGSLHGMWTVKYNGYGIIRIGSLYKSENDKFLFMKPALADLSQPTHANLVLSNSVFSNFKMSVWAKTENQLIKEYPQPYQVDWVWWHYTDDDHAYYFTCKPTGWELGKRDPAYPDGQRFLKTDTNFTCPIGTWHQYTVEQKDDIINVSIRNSGEQKTYKLVEFKDNERPYLSGNVGLYDEDSSTWWDDFEIVKS